MSKAASISRLEASSLKVLLSWLKKFTREFSRADQAKLRELSGRIDSAGFYDGQHYTADLAELLTPEEIDLFMRFNEMCGGDIDKLFVGLSAAAREKFLEKAKEVVG